MMCASFLQKYKPMIHRQVLQRKMEYCVSSLVDVDSIRERLQARKIITNEESLEIVNYIERKQPNLARGRLLEVITSIF